MERHTCNFIERVDQLRPLRICVRDTTSRNFIVKTQSKRVKLSQQSRIEQRSQVVQSAAVEDLPDAETAEAVEAEVAEILEGDLAIRIFLA